MARVQVEGLRSRAPTAPTARVVDTFVRPPAPTNAPSRASIIAEALGSVAPGVMSKAAEQRRKEEMLRAEKAYLMDGMANDINSVANGDKYAQESKVFLQHYKELRTRGYVQSELNNYGSDLLNGRLTDEQGNPLLVDNIDSFNQLADKKVQELVGSISDPLVIDVVSPAIREWRHNTGVSFNSQLNKKLQADRERAYIDVINSHIDKVSELGVQGVAQALSQEADDWYALTRDGKSTEKVVDQLVAMMDASGDFRFGDIALSLKQGGNNLSATQIDKIIDAKEALQTEIETTTRAQAAAREKQERSNRVSIENDVLTQLLQPENLNNPRAVIQSMEQQYMANGGSKKDLYGLLNTVTSVTGFKTPAMESNKIDFQTEILLFANSSNPSQTPREYALKQLRDNPGLIHPDDIPAVLSFAQSAEQSSSLLANSEVSDFRKRAVESTLGTIAFSQSLKPSESRARFEIETEFDQRFQERYAEVFRESGTVTPAEIRQIGQQVTQELITEREQSDTLSFQQRDTADKSLSGVTVKTWGVVHGIDDVDDIVVTLPAGQTEDKLYELFKQDVLPNPTALEPSSPTPNTPKWKDFENLTFPGAYAYFYERYKQE